VTDQPVIKQLNTRHLARHARRAIAERLGHGAAYALLAVERDGRDVILRLNSGGNALAVEPYLRNRGYQVRYDGTNPGGYGCAVRITLAAGPVPS
jgi:hypothetical protein